jgi:hypothetical protein
MSVKKKDAVAKELDLMDEVSLFDRIKKDGTITLDELMEELSKGGLKNIHFNEMSFNLEKFTLDNVEKTGFEENVDKILDDTLNHSIELENNPEVPVDINKDINLLDCVLSGHFEEDDIYKILSLIDKNIIKEYIVSKIRDTDLDLMTCAYILMDLRK